MSGPRGIAGLAGREPVGVVVTAGRKALPGDGTKPGTPINRERFYLMMPDPAPVEGVMGGARIPHPAFAAYNAERRGEVPVAPTERARLIGRLAHATEVECFHYSRRLQIDSNTRRALPSRRPFCVGDGVRAVRIRPDGPGGAEQEHAIECLGDRCPYATGLPDGCKPSMRFLFQLGWDGDALRAGMPTPLAKFTSQSWNTIRNFIGFFERIRAAAAAEGWESYSIAGFPFELTIQPKLGGPDGRRKFPVSRIAPLHDPISWFRLDAAERREALGVSQPVSLLVGPEATPRTEALDWSQNTPGLHAELLGDDEES